MPDEKLFRVFDLGFAIHGSEFVCFLRYIFIIDFEGNS